MNNLYLYYDYINNGYQTILLDLFYTLAIISAISVITTKNPVISVLFLIGLFLIISLYLISIGAPFLGFSYLLVYVGAISILFIFILMLINIRISELVSDTKNSIILVFIVAIFFGLVLQKIFSFRSISKVLEILNIDWDNNIIDSSHITSIGNIMYTNYSIWLLIASLILLLAMLGAIVITIKPEKTLPHTTIYNTHENDITIK